MLRLEGYRETMVTTSVRDSYFDTSHIISSEDNGLRFAFAVTAADGSTDFVDESEYGEIIAV